MAADPAPAVVVPLRAVPAAPAPATAGVEPLIDLAAACAVLGIGIRTGRRMLARGAFPGFTRIGKLIRVRPAALREFIDAGGTEARR